MRMIVSIFLVSIFLFTSGCGAVESKVYAPDVLKSVKVWFLEFAYESGSVELSQKKSGDSEVKVVSRGHLPRDLQLRDDLFFIFKDEYQIPITKKSSEAHGRIQIHPIHFYSGGFKLLTVTLIDNTGATLARIKVANSKDRFGFMDDDKFTRYAAEAIVNAIKQK